MAYIQTHRRTGYQPPRWPFTAKWNHPMVKDCLFLAVPTRGWAIDLCTDTRAVSTATAAPYNRSNELLLQGRMAGMYSAGSGSYSWGNLEVFDTRLDDVTIVTHWAHTNSVDQGVWLQFADTNATWNNCFQVGTWRSAGVNFTAGIYGSGKGWKNPTISDPWAGEGTFGLEYDASARFTNAGYTWFWDGVEYATDTAGSFGSPANNTILGTANAGSHAVAAVFSGFRSDDNPEFHRLWADVRTRWAWVEELGRTTYFITAAGPTPITKTPPVGSLAFAGQAPQVAVSGAAVVEPTIGSLTFTGQVPQVDIAERAAVLPTIGSLTFTGQVPQVDIAERAIVLPGVGSLTSTGQAPLITLTGEQAVQPSVGSLTLTGLAPQVSATGEQVVAPTLGSLTLTGLAPQVDLAERFEVLPTLGSLAFTGQVPTTLVAERLEVQPTVGSLVIAGQAPILVEAGQEVAQPLVGSLTFTGVVPTLSLVRRLEVLPTVGSLTLTGYAPSLAAGATVQPAVGSLAFTGQVPGLKLDILLTPTSGAIVFTGQQPQASLGGDRTVLPAVGSLATTGYAPDVTVPLSGLEAIAAAVWSLPMDTQEWPVGSFGWQVQKKLLTTGKFIGLK